MACLLSNIFAPTKAKGQKMSNEIHRCNEVLCHYSAIKGPVCYVKISQEVSPTQVAVLSAFVANGRK